MAYLDAADNRIRDAKLATNLGNVYLTPLIEI